VYKAKKIWGMYEAGSAGATYCTVSGARRSPVHGTSAARGFSKGRGQRGGWSKGRAALINLLNAVEGIKILKVAISPIGGGGGGQGIMEFRCSCDFTLVPGRVG